MKIQGSRGSVCALISGGLDSGALLSYLVARYRQVYPVYVRQGLIWEDAELRHLRSFLRALPGPAPALPRFHALTILDLPMRDLYGRHWSTTGHNAPGSRTPDVAVRLPGRNLVLLTKAAVFCAQHRIPTIAIGSLDHNPFPDATLKFFHRFAAVAGVALDTPLRVIAPFRKLTKTQVIRRARALPLHLSFSCLAPQHGRHCGGCNKCAEGQRAFREAGVVDRTRYAA